jgi:hypothetical protein
MYILTQETREAVGTAISPHSLTLAVQSDPRDPHQSLDPDLSLRAYVQFVHSVPWTT